MLNTVKNAMYTIGDSTADFAKLVGNETADFAKLVGNETAELAKRIGPKRAIIGLVVLGAVVGGSIFLVRYLRARKEDLPVEGDDEQGQGRKHKRNTRRGGEAQYQH